MFREFRLQNRLIPVVFMIVAAGCSTTPELVLPARGSMATVTYGRTIVTNAELLAIQNDTLFAVTDSLISVPLDMLDELQLMEGSRSWMVPVILLQLLPGGLTMVSNHDNMQKVGTFLWGMGIGAWAALEFSQPETWFRNPLSEENIKAVALYCRFPYGAKRELLELIGATQRTP